MPDHTHSDKPDLPPKRPAGVDETMETMRSAFIDVTLHAHLAITLCQYIELLERKVADERRKALESAIAECDRMYEHRAVNGFAREASTARALANKLRSWIDRREPTK